MRYFRLLPSEHSLTRLAYEVSFPASRNTIRDSALRRRFSRAMADFLSLFAEEEVFQNGVDFINQCEELKLLIREARNAPNELLRSPQG